MPDMQSSTPPSAAPAALDLPQFDDGDIALGFECAYPTLQIERWQLESRGADAN